MSFLGECLNFPDVKAAYDVYWPNLSSCENCQWLQTILDIHKLEL